MKLTDEVISDMEKRMKESSERYDDNDGTHEAQRDAYEHAYDIASDVAYKAIEMLKVFLKGTA